MSCYPGCPSCPPEKVVTRSSFEESWVPSGLERLAKPSVFLGNDRSGKENVIGKLRELDPYRHAALLEIVDWIGRDPEALVAMARGRHAEGHYRYGDRQMYGYSQAELTAEASQELADAINYLALRLSRG